MNKTLLIIRREYLTRIRNKTFILSTLLTPILLIGVIAFSVYMQMNNSDDLKIAVYDESGFFAGKLNVSKSLVYVPVNRAVYDSFLSKKTMEAYDGLLYVPRFDVNKPQGVQYMSEKSLGLFSQSQVEDDLNEVLERERMVLANIDTAKLATIKQNEIELSQKIISEDEDGAEANAGVSSAIGYGSGMVLYLLMFVYGSMVMRGVMEEKTNRIAEVMVSSVTPMQLMAGKILGIGAVGLTQFVIWIVLIVIGLTAFAASMGPGDAQAMADAGNSMQQMQGGGAANLQGMMQGMTAHLNIPLLVGAFIFYFIFGYLFYASLFAAVGSAVNEDPQDAQAMMFPITIPIILSFVMMTSVVGNPTGSMAVWGSIVPFTAPILMMARLPYGLGTVAPWELAASMISMILGFLFVAWLSGRIYRTGILMYGKKANWGDLLKWATRKN